MFSSNTLFNTPPYTSSAQRGCSGQDLLTSLLSSLRSNPRSPGVSPTMPFLKCQWKFVRVKGTVRKVEYVEGYFHYSIVSSIVIVWLVYEVIYLIALSQLYIINIPIMFQVATGVTLDANWRWIHGKDGYENCYTGNEWDQSYCPDAATCTENCLLGRTL